jgi:hypothetical protein
MKQKIKISKVIPNKDNPRVIKDSKFKELVKSIKGFPKMFEKRPIVVDENMVVLGGNMRLKAAQSAGLKEVWIDDTEDWTDEEKKEFIIKDNVPYGEWEWDMLANEWDSVLLNEYGLDVWQNQDDVEDIEEIVNFNEDVNFVIKCANLKELERLQAKLNTGSKKIKFDDFLIKAKL